MKVSIFNTKGEELKTLATLAPEIFEVEPKEELLARYVRTYQHNQRQGTVKTKNRKDVSGGGRKPWPQKGTGRARHGSIRSPLWVGGGTVFGPQPRDWGLKLPKKMRRKALFMALSDKVQEDGVVVLNKLTLSKISTKEINRIIENVLGEKLEIVGKILIVLPGSGEEENVYLSARNIPNVQCVPVQSLNAYLVLEADKIIFTKNSLSLLEDIFFAKG
ncbi:MAG: 50S ribosomal protein L4 [Patescibacteria group bacterium]|nr:50S ribosomal protein L4 [Patescibacteria group bacterium]